MNLWGRACWPGEKGMQCSFPRYPLLYTVKFCQLISGDPKETVMSEPLVLRGLGSAKHPEFHGLIWAYQQWLTLFDLPIESGISLKQVSVWGFPLHYDSGQLQALTALPIWSKNTFADVGYKTLSCRWGGTVFPNCKIQLFVLSEVERYISDKTIYQHIWALLTQAGGFPSRS